MRILLATSNPHKIDEIHAVFAAQSASDPRQQKIRIELLSLADFPNQIPEPEETGQTFEENAFLKARYCAAALCPPDTLCLADDSGLEVDALAGRPGVRSARYAGVPGPRAAADLANNQLLLENLKAVPPEKRIARFVCAMALVKPLSCLTSRDREGVVPPSSINHTPDLLALLRGVIEGRILGPDNVTPAGRGQNGFGYDPLFLIPSLSKTTAELSPEQKNTLSHRGQAARLLWHQIQKRNFTTQ